MQVSVLVALRFVFQDKLESDKNWVAGNRQCSVHEFPIQPDQQDVQIDARCISAQIDRAFGNQNFGGKAVHDAATTIYPCVAPQRINPTTSSSCTTWQ